VDGPRLEARSTLNALPAAASLALVIARGTAAVAATAMATTVRTANRPLFFLCCIDVSGDE
jgi:hypothetical protein